MGSMSRRREASSEAVVSLEMSARECMERRSEGRSRIEDLGRGVTMAGSASVRFLLGCGVAAAAAAAAAEEDEDAELRMWEEEAEAEAASFDLLDVDWR